MLYFPEKKENMEKKTRDEIRDIMRGEFIELLLMLNEIMRHLFFFALFRFITNY